MLDKAMFPDETIQELERTAATCAAKLCRKNCIAFAGACEKPHSPMEGVPVMNAGFKCPLARFNIEHKEETRPFWQIPSSEIIPTWDELFAICAVCEASVVDYDENDDATLVANRPNFEVTCLDCPVWGASEAKSEAEAESRC